ncbi:hypothetical protein [Natronomonas gomsonensis]|uniref:hypothetical protein n=1 Tax=Natronomonas gomsonensis TaxID=1046043 RepID=UPI0015BFF743|nr:hypothetical protein [Natronomonas gomsonensis]
MRDRGILTERDREIIPNEPNNDRRPEVKTRVRNRIERLEEDLQILADHEPELAEKLRDTICTATEHNRLEDVLNDIQDDIAAIRENVDN